MSWLQDSVDRSREKVRIQQLKTEEARELRRKAEIEAGINSKADD